MKKIIFTLFALVLLASCGKAAIYQDAQWKPGLLQPVDRVKNIILSTSSFYTLDGMMVEIHTPLAWVTENGVQVEFKRLVKYFGNERFVTVRYGGGQIVLDAYNISSFADEEQMQKVE
jgi:putative transposon-encoded protein